MTSNRNYVAAWVDYKADKIVVLERDEAGNLHRKKFHPPYYFYVPADDGEYESIFGDKLTRVEFATKDEYEFAKNHFDVKFESDIAPLKRVLMDNYYGVPAPKVNFAFLDIEVDTKKALGWARPTNPYGIINAVTVYQSWTGKFLTYAVPPMVDGVRWDLIPGNTVDIIYEELNALIKAGQLRDQIIPEIVFCKDEYELIVKMLAAIQDADIISGWNSEFFDIPYIAERLLLAGGESLLARLDHAGVRLPQKEMVNRFGTEEPVYKLTGRSHLDYMKLFQKFTFEGRTSYALGNILQEEVGVGKLEYEGSLEDLYVRDFVKFVLYNFRDVDGIVQLDTKFKFIALANQMAHENTVHFDAVLGTVAYVETGITNHAHNVLNKIVHDKRMSSHEKVEGAIVLTPKIGLYENIGSVDIASLYPNTIRSLNISPEKIVGQFVEKEVAWRDIWDCSDKRHCFVFESGEQQVMTASEWGLFLVDNKYAVSAYGTVFDQGNGRGVVADILGFWYTERKRLQAEKKKYAKLAKDEQDPIKKAEYKVLEEHYDLLQLTKKISMNSLYGALLNIAFRFGDERMGASVTGSGRGITTHMIETLGELLTGELSKLIKTTTMDKDGKVSHNYESPNDAIIYSDTDSCYFKTYATSDDEAVLIADEVAEATNATFPKFMRDAFKCQPGFDTLITANREIVGRRGLFQAKKKYVIKVINLDGFPVNKLKSMGSEIKKADTPKVIQKFLKTTVDMILEGEEYSNVVEYVNEQRKSILKGKGINIFSLGVAKQVNNLDKYLSEFSNPGTQKYQDKNGKWRSLTIPGHVKASLHYNTLLQEYDKGEKEISSGDKVVIFYVKPNQFNYDAIAFPAEFSKFPSWFNEHFEVNVKKTEDKMFDNKLEGIFSALGKDVPSPQSVLTNKILEF